MRIWCETCYGSGIIGSKHNFGTGFETCADCSGKGYAENETIEYEARVGRATMMWFENDLSMYDTENDVAIHSVESLVDWVEGEDVK